MPPKKATQKAKSKNETKKSSTQQQQDLQDEEEAAQLLIANDAAAAAAARSFIADTINQSVEQSLSISIANELSKRTAAFTSAKFQLQLHHCINNYIPPLLKYDQGDTHFDSSRLLLPEVEPTPCEIDRNATIRIPRRSMQVSERSERALRKTRIIAMGSREMAADGYIYC